MAIAMAQTATGEGTATDTINVSFSSTPGTGGLCVVLFGGIETGGDFAVSSVSDNQTNTYTQRVASPSAGTLDQEVYIYDAPIDTASGTFTVSVTMTSAGAGGQQPVRSECLGRPNDRGRRHGELGDTGPGR